MTDFQNEDKPESVKPRSRGIYLLPNLFTTGALFSGFYAVVASMNGHFENAAVAIFVAMVLDGLGWAGCSYDQYLQCIWCRI